MVLDTRQQETNPCQPPSVDWRDARQRANEKIMGGFSLFRVGKRAECLDKLARGVREQGVPKRLFLVPLFLGFRLIGAQLGGGQQREWG